MNILSLEQGSVPWLAYRRTKRMASEAPCVMGQSIYAPKTWKHLARIKRGLDVIEENPAMRMGTTAEPLIRAQLEEMLDKTFQPMVVEDGEYAASLDGMTLDGDTFVEIKLGSPDSDRMRCARDGVVPIYDRPQIRHQAMVAGANCCIYAVGDGVSTPKIIRVKFAIGGFEELRAKWDEFWPLMTAPESDLIELVERSDKSWLEAASEWQQADKAAKDAQAVADEKRKTLCEMAGDLSARGGGVKVSRYVQSGSIAYTKIPELANLDLERYRAKSAVRYRVASERGMEEST